MARSTDAKVWNLNNFAYDAIDYDAIYIKQNTFFGRFIFENIFE